MTDLSQIFKFQIDLLSFSFEKTENMNCNVHKTVIDKHFHLLPNENGNCIYQKVEQVTFYKTYSSKFGRKFLFGDKVCVTVNLLFSY